MELVGGLNVQSLQPSPQYTEPGRHDCSGHRAWSDASPQFNRIVDFRTLAAGADGIANRRWNQPGISRLTRHRSDGCWRIPEIHGASRAYSEGHPTGEPMTRHTTQPVTPPDLRSRPWEIRARGEEQAMRFLVWKALLGLLAFDV